MGGCAEVRNVVADIFISYSRRDIAFVERLYATLQQAHREPWVDWSDIPPTADWLKEIFAAIESSDAFVCVLSPDWVASATCQLEAKHAIETKKRIIPLLYRDTESNKILPELAAKNWILFRDIDAFTQSFRLLESALDTDLTYWRLSSQLLTRARTWADRGHDANITLRGKELTEAEHWLAESANILPTPTRLQIEFITASRRAITRRQRTTAGVFGVSTCIFLILSIIAFALYQDASTQQNIATQQRNTAIARQLALQSSVALSQDQPDVALLLSDEATKLNANVQTRDALLNAIIDSPHIATLYYAPDRSVSQVTVSPDGTTLYGVGSHLYAWNLANPAHTPTTLLAASDLTGSRPPSIASVVVSHSGKLLAVIADDRISLVQANTGKILQKIEPPNLVQGLSSGVALAFNNDDSRFILADEYSTVSHGNTQDTVRIQQYNTTTGTVVGASLSVPYNSQQPFTLSGDGSLFAIAECPVIHCAQAQVQVWNVALGQLTATMPITVGGVNALTFSADNSMLAIGACSLDPGTDAYRCNHGTIQIWSMVTHSLRESAAVTNALGEVQSLAFSPDGHYLVSSLLFGTCLGSNCNAGQLQLWSLQGLQMIGEPFAGHLLDAASPTFLRDELKVATASGGSVYIWNARGYDALSPIIVYPDYQNTIPDSNMAYDPSGSTLSMRNGHDIYTWDPLASRLITKPIASFAIHGDGFVALTADASIAAECESDILLWSRSTQTITQTLHDSEDTGPCQDAAFSRNSAYLAAAFAQYNPSRLSVTIWNAKTGQLTRRINISGQLSLRVALNEDGSILATLSDNSTLTLWNVKSGTTIGAPIKLSQRTSDFTFSPNGNTLAFLQDGVTIMDVYTHKIVATLTPPPGESGYAKLAFSPNGRYIAAMGYYTLTVWDVNSQTDYADFPHPGSNTLSAVFSPDSRYLAWDSLDGIIIVRPLDLQSWQSEACAIAHRNLTRAEWSLYVQGLSYTTVCPGV